MLISNNEYIKQWVYQAMIISNNDYIEQWLYKSMIILINDYINHHLEESSLNTFLLQTGLKGTSRISREKCEGILQNIFEKNVFKI